MKDMDSQICSITLTKKQFESEDKLFNALSEQIVLLIKLGYTIIASRVDDKKGEYIIDFCNTSKEDTPKPFWLYEPEAYSALITHTKIAIDFHKNMVEELEEQLQDLELDEEDRSDA